MPIYNHRVLIILPASERDAANAAASADLPGATDADLLTFTQGLNASGSVSDLVTFYWADVALDDAGFAVVQGLEQAFPGSSVLEYDLEADPGFPARTIAGMGLKVITPPEGA